MNRFPLHPWQLRLATFEDIPALEFLIRESVEGLQGDDYSREQREASMGVIFGVDRQLIKDETYYIVTTESAVIGCGGWSKRRSWFGGDQVREEPEPELDPKLEPARIRAFFVHPDWARQGIGREILSRCESAAQRAGFSTLELVATLTGEPLYASQGFTVIQRLSAELPGELTLPVVRMGKRIHRPN